MGCPAPETLAGLVEGSLDEEERATLVAHTESCAACRAAVVDLVRGTAPTAPTGDKGAATGALAAGTEIGRYVIEGQLGAGGMGVVYLAEDPELGRPVALKLLRRGGHEAGERLRGEARALAQLAHPNVVTVHDVGEHEGRIFVAMERVDGLDLRRWLRERPRGWREIVECLIAAARGLEAAHAAGLVHRDIKPDNILVGRDGRVRVSDFGLATSVDDASDDALAGTPAYVSPERAEGTGDEVAADTWSFAVTLHEALYDERPFAGASIAELFAAITAGQLRPPPAGTKVPRWLRKVTARGLARDPSARWPSMAALRTALERGVHRRRTAVVAIAGSVAVAGIAIAWGLTRGGAPAVSCTDAGKLPDGIWTAARRDQIARAFEATGHPSAKTIASHAAGAVDRWTASWQAASVDACEATRARGHTAALRERRTVCLDARLYALDALVGRWEHADLPSVDRAAAAVDGLGTFEACSGAALVAATSSPEADALRADLLRALALDQAGDTAGGAAALERIAGDAAALADPALAAEVDLARGRHALLVLDNAGADPLLRAALRGAEASSQDRLKAEVCIELVVLYGRTHRFAEAHQWSEYATAALDRIGGDAGLAAQLDQHLGVVLEFEGKHAEASVVFARAAERQRATLGDDSVTLAETLELLAISLAEQDRRAESDDAHAQAVAIWKRVWGDAAAQIATVVEAWRAQDLEAGDLAAVIAHDEAALQALKVAFPDDHSAHALAETQLGFDCAIAGLHDDAIAHQTRAIALRDGLGDRSALLAEALSELGAESIEVGRPAPAIAAYRRAAEVAIALGEPAEQLLAAIRGGLGLAYLLADDAASAREPLEQALAWREAHPPAVPAQIGTNRFALARAVFAEDEPRARKLVAAARADYERAIADFADLHGVWDRVRERVQRRQADLEAWATKHLR